MIIGGGMLFERISRPIAAVAGCLLAAMSNAVRAEVASSELARYLAAPDPSYAWRELQTTRYDSCDIIELGLTSQTWRGIAWKHQLVLVRPPNMDPQSKQVFLFVHGGRWKDEYENGFKGELPRQTKIFTRLAKTLKAPVAVLRQVPFQPICER